MYIIIFILCIIIDNEQRTEKNGTPVTGNRYNIINYCS